MLAPIVLFVYNRPGHTGRLLESLAANNLAAASRLFIFSDGPKGKRTLQDVERVRATIKETAGFKSCSIIERKENYGLARSIIEGVTTVCAEFGRVIVLEDDLVVSKHFLEYMNTALDQYENDDQVMQISAHMFPVDLKTDTDAVFLPFTTSWGWATWQRAWKHFDANMTGYETLRKDRKLRRKFNLDGSYPYFAMLEKQRDGKIDSWAIRWYLSVFMKNGLTLFPVKSLVENIGFDSSGVHCGSNSIKNAPCADFSAKRFPPVRVDENFKRALFDSLISSSAPAQKSTWHKIRSLCSLRKV